MRKAQLALSGLFIILLFYPYPVLATGNELSVEEIQQSDCIILKKDRTLAEQMTEANTIYEILYSFDLKGAKITIPQGCTLKFSGGRFSNSIW